MRSRGDKVGPVFVPLETPPGMMVGSCDKVEFVKLTRHVRLAMLMFREKAKKRGKQKDRAAELRSPFCAKESRERRKGD